jgi:predicted O-methyltransferase YrrM
MDDRALRDPTSNDALVEKYRDVRYAAQANPQSHPDRMHTIGTLHGLAPPDVARARVLELGCSDGSNLLPMAAGLPDASFVGCDLSPEAIASARNSAAELGLDNVTFVECDLRELPAELGPFDYVIAHGVYSWVPPPVRDALFALAANRLSPNGLMFVSFNVLPGCHVRQAAWEVLHLHSDGLDDPRVRLDAARRLAAAIAEGGISQDQTDALLRREFARIAQQTDSTLYHDELAVPNDPVYFRHFAAHARRHGLAFVAEGKLYNSSDIGLAPSMRSLVAGLDRLEREQYLDFACLRRFRQSLLCRAESEAKLALDPERAALMQVAASHSLLGAAERGKPLFNPVRSPLDPTDQRRLGAALARLVEVAPRALAVAELEAVVQSAASIGGARAGSSFASLLVDACYADEVLLSVCPPRIAEIPSERPLASVVARWQARRGEQLTNLWHISMSIPDVPARALLALLDGSRDRAALDAAGVLPGAGDPVLRQRRIEGYVRQFGRLGLLIS